MKGILADINIQGQTDALITLLGREPWKLFWDDLHLRYCHFSDVGLDPDAPDSLIWQVCQEQQLVLLTNNRNQDNDESLETTIRANNTADSLPVFTIGNVYQLRNSRDYGARVAEKMLDFLSHIENLRGTGRLYLP